MLTSCDLLFSDLQTQEKEEPIIREGSLKVSESAVLHHRSRVGAFPVEPLWALLAVAGCCCPVFSLNKLRLFRRSSFHLPYVDVKYVKNEGLLG